MSTSSNGRVPTEQQYLKLRVLADGAMALAPGRRDWKPLIRRGWVALEAEDDGSRYLPPLRITGDGLRALALAVDRYGLPEIKGPPKQLNEAPAITELKAKLGESREETRAAERKAHDHAVKLARVQRALEGFQW